MFLPRRQRAPDSSFEAKVYQLQVSNRYGTLGRWLGIFSIGLLFSPFTSVNLSYLSVFHIMAGGIARREIVELFR
jgi:hypothetical protein